MLTIPSHTIWNEMNTKKILYTAPAHGLYFTGVVYKPKKEWNLKEIVENPRGVRLKSFFENRIQ